MLRLKGQTGSGEWVEFGLRDISGANERFCRVTDKFGNVMLLAATIQPADDQRKAMLDDIRTRMYQEFDSNEHRFIHEVMITILAEMEAKL